MLQKFKSVNSCLLISYTQDVSGFTDSAGLAETPHCASPFRLLLYRTDTRECGKPASMPVTYRAGTAAGR